MVASRNFRFRLESVLIYLGLGIFAFIAVTPFLHTIARSFSAEAPILRGEVYIWPVGFSFDAYERLVIGGTFWLAYRNSFFITTSATLVQMLMTILCAYPLSRTYLPGRNIFMTLIVFQMIFPPSLIPFYLTVREVGLIDSWGSLIWPYAINTFNMIVLKSYFQALPRELEESAIIDGANDFRVLIHIMLPLSVPVLLTLTLFYVVANWNLFLPAIFFINDGNKQPLQVILRDMIWSMQLATQTASADDFERLAGMEALKASSVIIAAIPMLVAYPFFQRFFIKGILLGAIKG
ncbi:MAG: carbohydrate ABC transporter permease [Caldilineaceae bacterium]|uniref:Carbohydrate ABC transporter permease n=1 Tax=Caldilineaceae bacterium SB0675_bin_29 TaxID=2605266 RepID=A0A6B1FRW4_9CHLR|nr:carbohydrate ABC transporter permease [Caldilineaceae bacterium]MYH60362.1 carbohydrate ABC transporter permease [Caldilineaceae bacterium SB0675_bin_29]